MIDNSSSTLIKNEIIGRAAGSREISMIQEQGVAFSVLQAIPKSWSQLLLKEAKAKVKLCVCVCDWLID
jgi:hypothetical protein